MKILVDRNPSPEWVAFLARPGWVVRRWHEVGPPPAEDPEIAARAAEHGFFILTQDLDFSDLLFMTLAVVPSVILLRSRDELSPEFRAHVLRCIVPATPLLREPSLLVIDRSHARWRPLPFGRDAGS